MDVHRLFEVVIDLYVIDEYALFIWYIIDVCAPLFEYICDRLRYRTDMHRSLEDVVDYAIDKYATFTWICGRLRYRRICTVHKNVWSTMSSTDMRWLRRLLEDVTDYAIDKYMPLLDYVIEGYMHCLLEFVPLADKRRYTVAKLHM